MSPRPFTAASHRPNNWNFLVGHCRYSPDAEERARRVQLILMDVDGVLTNGQIFLIPDGRGGIQEIKVFDVQDGVGISFAHRAGLRTGIVTGRLSESVTARAQELGIGLVEQGSWNKLESYEKLRVAAEAQDQQIAFIGDDWQDVPILRRVGFAIAVANARPEVKEGCHLVTACEGGRGAVREAIEFILRAQGKWGDVISPYLS
ncbi:MAG: HAD hydrolase family protein [Acidobacteria bacterium]|nr:HAD hydrolase family protein [Acidobacteriota bacterium]